MIEKLDRERVWDQWPRGKPYGSLGALVRSEIGKSLDELEAHVVARRATDRTNQGTINTSIEDVPESPGERTDLANLARLPRRQRAASVGISEATQKKIDCLARLEDRSLYQAVVDGRMSVNRAAIEAGFVKPTATIKTEDVDHAAL
jgi:hypothetical protein